MTPRGFRLAGRVFGLLQRLLPSGTTTQLAHLDEVFPSPFGEKTETSLPSLFNQLSLALLFIWLLQFDYSTPMIRGATSESAGSFGYVAPRSVVTVAL